MPIDYYYIPVSPPCKAVEFAAAACNVALIPHELNFKTKDHLKPEFLAINPQHTVPAIVDEGFALWESRAILRYLASVYGGDTNLYPKDPKSRALVDLRLDFDLGTLYSSFYRYLSHFFFNTKPDPENLKKLEVALKLLEAFLEKSTYAAGYEMTIADMSLLATVSGIDAFEIIDLKTYSNITRWYELMKQTAPKYQDVTAGWFEMARNALAERKEDL